MPASAVSEITSKDVCEDERGVLCICKGGLALRTLAMSILAGPKGSRMIISQVTRGCQSNYPSHLIRCSFAALLPIGQLSFCAGY